MRTLVKDHADEDAVQAIQDATKLVPLSKWNSQGLDYTPAPPKTPDTTVNVIPMPGTQSGTDPLAFFDALNADLKTFQPPAADQPLLDQLASVGIGVGLKPVSTNKKLSDATLAGLREAVQGGPAKVTQLLTQRFGAGFASHNGWLVEPTGNYGTDYNLRAIIDKIGLGALPSNVAIYPVAQTDRTAAPLNGGTKHYVAHFNAPGNPFVQLPIPANAFWSLTLYDATQFFVPNELARYLLNDRSEPHYNADGSLDIYLQTTKPTDPDQLKNWLPAPAAAFNLLMRVYGPPGGSIAGILDGSAWKPPTILSCGPTGFTPAFPPAGIAAPIACAS